MKKLLTGLLASLTLLSASWAYQLTTKENTTIENIINITTSLPTIEKRNLRTKIMHMHKKFHNNTRKRTILETLLTKLDASMGIVALGGAYSRQGDIILRENHAIESADAETFHVIASDTQYAKDKYNAYLGKDNIRRIDHTGPNIYDTYLRSVDVDTFLVMGNGYTKDKNRIYYNTHDIDGVDLKSFVVLGLAYAKDKNHIYSLSRKIEGVDRQTFELLSHGYAKDKKTIYKRGIPLTFDVKTFKVIDQKTVMDINGTHIIE